MSVDVVNSVENCEIGQESKVPRTGPTGIMGIREQNEPWSIIATDIMGPLP